MDYLVTGLYVLSLLACCVGLWLWYEIESLKDYIGSLRGRVAMQEARIDELQTKRR